MKLRLKLRSLLFLITPSFHVDAYDTVPSTPKEGFAASGKEYYILLQLVHNELHNIIHPVVL